jgi:hypothetical protein
MSTLRPEDLNQFTGTSQWYKVHTLLITDGVKHFCDEVGGYWVLDIIWSVQELLKSEDFVLITLDVGESNNAHIKFTDGDKGDGPVVLYQQFIGYTDCPPGEWKFYQEGDVVLVPSEH